MRRRLLFAAFVLGIALLNLAVFQTNAVLDLTPNRRFTLQPESVRVARKLPNPTTVEVFLPAGSRFGKETKQLLERYATASRAIRYAFVDPATQPARLLAEDVHQGQAIVRARGKRIVADDTAEQTLTSVFLRLLRSKDKTVCFTSGHGERDISDPGPTGLTGWAAALKAGGYEIAALGPGALGTGARPPCDVLVVAGPTAPFTLSEAGAFQAFLRDEGKALVAVDPPAYQAAETLTAPWGIGVVHGLVVDPVQSLQRDILTPVVSDYPSLNQTVASLRAATVWPNTAALTGGGLVEGRTGLYVSTLARTSDASWVELGGGPGFQPGVDLKGPVLVAASSDYSSVGGREQRVPSDRPRVLRTRLVALGTVNLASNAFIDLLGDGRIALDAVAWLSLDEELIGLVPKSVDPSAVALTASRRRALLWWAIALPASIAIGASAAAWALRRR